MVEACSAPAHSSPQVPASRSGGPDVDDDVPEALQWEDEGRCVVEPEGGASGVNDTVNAVDGGRNPYK